MIVLCRYGQLKNFSVPLNSIYAVANRTGLPYTTVQRTLHNFLKNGYKFSSRKQGRKRFENIPSDIQDELCSSQLQQHWASYPLRKRVLMIKQRWNVEISASTLRLFYKSKGIRYGSTQIVYRNALKNRASRDEHRESFAVFLANIIANKHPVVYVDESSFGSQEDRLRKAWCNENEPVEVHINNKMLFRTMYGAIGECLNKPVFMKGKSTN